LFFLNFHNQDGSRFGAEILDPSDKIAEDRSHFYGMQSFVFPYMDWLSANEIAQARLEMIDSTQEFRERIDKWAGICYANPDSNKGLDYFRENLKDFLPSMQAKALEVQSLKNAAVLSHNAMQSEIIIGEAPIGKIWLYYKNSGAISEEIYDDLIRLKKAQYPKYEGRWPVFVFASLADNYTDEPLLDINSEVPSVRKTISVD
jgi:hypothetical protein